MNTFKKYWYKIWFGPFDPISSSLFRISLGLLAIVFYIALYPSWFQYFGANGITSLHSPLRSNDVIDPWNLFYLTENWMNIRVLWWLALLSTICFTVGFKTRIATIFMFVMQTSLIHRTSVIVNGEDMVMRMLLFYSCFAPLGRKLSVDAWIRTRNNLPPLKKPEGWPIRLMQINVLLVYWITVPNRFVDDVAWLNGTAIYYSIVNNFWSRWPWPAVFYSWDGLLSKVFSYGTILVEGSFPVLVWFKKTRPYILFAALSLHIGIAVVLKNIAFFPLSIACAFWTFVPPETSYRFVRFVKKTLKIKPA